MLVKYACDCIGFPRRDDKDESAFILQVCDNDSLSSRWHFQFRPMRGKTDTPLPIEESEKILEQIGQLVSSPTASVCVRWRRPTSSPKKIIIIVDIQTPLPYNTPHGDDEKENLQEEMEKQRS
jgi:hypothetical protein